MDPERKRKRPRKGLCGLVNLGNTCYMNSALQCLSNTPELTQYFLSGNTDPEGTRGEMANAYANLIGEMWSGQHAFINPTALKKVIGERHSLGRFRGNEQEDSQELVSFLLDEVSQDLNSGMAGPLQNVEDIKEELNDTDMAELVWGNYTLKNSSIIVDLMYGMYKSTSTLMDCIDLFTKEEHMPLTTRRGQRDGWKCPKCKVPQPATKKRFKPSSFGSVKIDTPIEIPLELDLSNKLIGPDCKKRSHVYDLFAMSNHVGTPLGGHYTTIALNDKTWYFFDDEKVPRPGQMSEKFYSSEAYFLFYRRRTSDSSSGSILPTPDTSPAKKKSSLPLLAAPSHGGYALPAAPSHGVLANKIAREAAMQLATAYDDAAFNAQEFNKAILRSFRDCGNDICTRGSQPKNTTLNRLHETTFCAELISASAGLHDRIRPEIGVEKVSSRMVDELLEPYHMKEGRIDILGHRDGGKHVLIVEIGIARGNNEAAFEDKLGEKTNQGRDYRLIWERFGNCERLIILAAVIHVTTPEAGKPQTLSVASYRECFNNVLGEFPVPLPLLEKKTEGPKRIGKGPKRIGKGPERKGKGPKRIGKGWKPPIPSSRYSRKIRKGKSCEHMIKFEGKPPLRPTRSSRRAGKQPDDSKADDQFTFVPVYREKA